MTALRGGQQSMARERNDAQRWILRRRRDRHIDHGQAGADHQYGPVRWQHDLILMWIRHVGRMSAHLRGVALYDRRRITTREHYLIGEILLIGNVHDHGSRTLERLHCRHLAVDTFEVYMTRRGLLCRSQALLQVFPIELSRQIGIAVSLG